MDGYRWSETSIVRFDDKREFREKPEFGNAHVVFNHGSEWGNEHVDEYNALDFPNGTIDHLAKYTEEKTSIPQTVAKIGIIVGGIMIAKKISDFLEDK